MRGYTIARSRKVCSRAGCYEPAAQDRTKCATCLIYDRGYQRQKREARSIAGLCGRCGNHPAPRCRKAVA